jgi:hypothetical protein
MGIGTKTKSKPRRRTPRQKMEAAGPSLAKLKQLARTKRPPQSWYDQTDNPLKPRRK